MGIDGFSQTQYNQLLLDVRSGVPPPRPTLVVKLPIPRSKRPRTTKATDSSSETGNNEVGTTEVPKKFELDIEVILNWADRTTRLLRKNRSEDQRDKIAPVLQIDPALKASAISPPMLAITTFNI